MTDRDLEPLVPPDPDDAPGWAGWPAPARRRVALCALLDRIAELTAAGGHVRVLVPEDARHTWRGLGAALDSYGMAASVAAAGTEQDVDRVEMPTDAEAARRGAYGAALLGSGSAPVRHLGLTVAGDPAGVGAPHDAMAGPWEVLTDEGWRTTLTRAALLDPILALRLGQRLQAVVLATREPVILSAWH